MNYEDQSKEVKQAILNKYNIPFIEKIESEKAVNEEIEKLDNQNLNNNDFINAWIDTNTKEK